MYFLHIHSQQLMTFSIKNLFSFGCSYFASHMCLWSTLAWALDNVRSIMCVSTDTQIHTETLSYACTSTNTILKNAVCVHLGIYLHIHNDNPRRYLYVWIYIMIILGDIYIHFYVQVFAYICGYNKLLSHFHREVIFGGLMSMRTNVNLSSNQTWSSNWTWSLVRIVNPYIIPMGHSWRKGNRGSWCLSLLWAWNTAQDKYTLLFLHV